jgi:bromodomain-containing protein 7/9
MDFATVRRKLATGKYRTFAQFQHDVFLICKNAMKYNAPDTVYHKQALSIQELAKKKFERVKCEIRDSEKELKSEHKPMPNSLPAKQMKKPIKRIVHERAGSDFTRDPTPPAVDTRNIPSAPRAAESVKPALVDDFVESDAPFLGVNSKKGDDEQEGKGILPGFVRKPSVQDENRRETYQLSSQTIATPESIFEGEIKQLVPVGLEAEHSYSRSLARFAATLGSAAWQVAARRIEQALPPETKFGRGWVGEYEPLPTPVLMLQNRSLRESSFFTRSPCMNDGFKDGKEIKTSVSRSQHPVTGHHLKEKSMMFGGIRNEVTNKVPSKTEPTKTGRNQSLFGSPRTKPADSANFSYQQQIPPARVFAETDKRVLNPDKQNGTHSHIDSQADFAAYGVRYQQQNQPAKIFVETDKKFLNRVELNAALTPDPGRSDFASQSVRYQLQQQSQRSETDMRVVNSIELNGAPSLLNQRQSDFGTQRGVRFQQQNQPARIFAKPLELNGAPSPNRSQESFSTHSVNKQQQFPPTPIVNETRTKVKDEVELNGAPSPNHDRADFADHGVRYQQLNPPARVSAKNGEKVKNSLELNNSPSPYPTRPNFGVHWQASNNSSLQDSESNKSISINRNLLQRRYVESAVETQPAVHPVPSTRREDTGNAATTAARAWMSIGAAGGFRQDNTSSQTNHIQANSSHNHLLQDHQKQISRFRGEFPVNGMLFHPNMNRFPPIQGFVAPSHVRMGNETDFRNQQHPHNYHQMVFPQFVNRVQGGESISIQMPARQKQESMLPPDLNIGFQPSPARQSSSIDSQQPELALQL